MSSSHLSMNNTFNNDHVGSRVPLLLPRAAKISGMREKRHGGVGKKLRRHHSAPHLDVDIDNEEGMVDMETIIKNYKYRHYVFPLSRAALVFIMYLGVGVGCFYLLEQDLQGTRSDYRLLDALYMCIVTMTSVGYGDLTPRSVESRLFTCAFVFVGFGLMGWLLSGAANSLIERQEIILLKALSRTKNKFAHADPDPDPDPSHQMKMVQLKVVIAAFVFVVCFGMGLIVLTTIEGMDFVQAFYCVCVTVTTVGYGDYSFQTVPGRGFAVVWILVSTINVAQLYLYTVEWYMESRRFSLVKWVLNRKTTISDLEIADMDNDNVVSPAEFVIFKLKEMGKIEQNDVNDILKEFDTLDIDNSGTLSSRDLNLAQIVR